MLFTLLAVQLLAGRLDSPVTDRAEALAKQALAHGHEPRGAGPVIRLHALLDEVDDLNLLAEPFSILLARRSTDERVRVLAQMFMADVERARGRTVKAQDLVKDLGFVQDWYVVGSFENEGKGGCDTDFGPETATDLKATYPAKGHEVGWHKLPGHTVDGLVDLSMAVRPSTEAVAYALTVLQTENELRTSMSLGTSGGFRLFVNGVKVASSDRYNQARVDQQRVQVTLRKGFNRVLLKVCQETGQLGFYFRAERAEGSRGALAVVLPEVVPPLEKGSAPGAVKLPTLGDVLAERVKAAPSDAELRADYATALAWTRAWEEKEHTATVEAEKAADARPADPELQLIAATLEYEDVNQRRHYIERALQAAPKSPWARLQLAQHEMNREHADLSLSISSELTAELPNFAPAQLAKIHSLENLGMGPAAAKATDQAFAHLNFVPGIAREAVAQSHRLDRLSEAIARSRMVLALRYDDLNTRRGLGSMLADVGQVDEAAEQYRKVLALDPFDLQTVLRLADLLAANSKPTEARAMFEVARVVAPDEPEVYERQGRALLHAALKDDALAAFTRSLQLRPQNPALKETVRSLRGDDLADAAPFAMPLAPLLEQAKGLKGEDAVYLADVTAVRVQSNGLSSRFNQTVVKVMSDRGVEAFRSLPITYSPDRQEVRVLKARITKPDGSVVDSFGDQDRNINEPWTGMYYDAHARVLAFPSLEPGDVLEVQWRLEDTSIDNLLSDYWGDVEPVQSIFPKKHYVYVVDMPKTRPLYWNASSLSKSIKTGSAADNDRVVYTFRADDVAKIIPEPQMPGWAEVASPLHLSTYKSWEDVGRYWWGLVRDQLQPNDELRKTVEQVLKGVDRKDEAKVVAAIYGFVVTNTRYVALEFGIHGYKPYRVDRVLARRFGDCKDKASLIVAMLKVAGVDSRLVLLRMRNLGTLNAEPASLAAFNHAIAYVPSQKLYLDGTAEFYGSHEMPGADRVANVLVIEPDGKSQFLTTPEAAPEDNVSASTLEVQLKNDGSASAKGSLVTRGLSAPDVRRDYQTSATRQSVFEQKWAQSFPGLTASEVTLSDPKALEQPATLGFTMGMPRFAEASNSSLKFYPFGGSRAFTQVLAPLTERTWDVVFPGVWVDRQTWTYSLPAGFSLAEAPPDSVETSPFGSLKIRVKKLEGNKLLVEGEMVMSKARIHASEYPEFRAWLMRVDQAYSKKLVVQRGGQSASR